MQGERDIFHAVFQSHFLHHGKDSLYGFGFTFLIAMCFQFENQSGITVFPGLKVNVWTVDEVEDMKSLIEQKVDFITTNEPVILQEELKKHQ